MILFDLYYLSIKICLNDKLLKSMRDNERRTTILGYDSILALVWVHFKIIYLT